MLIEDAAVEDEVWYWIEANWHIKPEHGTIHCWRGEDGKLRGTFVEKQNSGYRPEFAFLNDSRNRIWTILKLYGRIGWIVDFDNCKLYECLGERDKILKEMGIEHD